MVIKNDSYHWALTEGAILRREDFCMVRVLRSFVNTTARDDNRIAHHEIWKRAGPIDDSISKPLVSWPNTTFYADAMLRK